MNTLWYDSETFSATPIKNGTYKYAENARIDIVSYAIDDGPVNVIDFTLDDPHDVWMLQDLLANAGTIIAHNAMFDRSVLRLGNLKIDIPIAKWRCSMVKALLHGLPGGLDKLCAILNVPQDLAKHKEGKALMMLFCKPLGKNRKLDVADRTTHPAEWARYLDYAKNDISAMREVWKRLPKWNYSEDNAGALERGLWHLDQKINDRGVPVDVPLVQAAIRATDDEQARLKEQVENHTDGYVHAATQRDKMLDFIFAEYGVAPQDLTKSSVAKLLEEDLDPMLRELLLIRQQASRSSTAKYAAFARGVNADDRLRGMLQFSGAARTRRDAGRTVQLQNLASRGLLKQNEIELGIEALMAGAEALVFDDVMQLTASTIRSVIAPKPGRKLVVADLANIEGRGLAWLAGEEWKLQAFRDYDEGRGPDLYKMAYAKSFGVSPDEVDAFGRQIGKTQELALGYAGGIGAFLTFSLAFGIDLDEMADLAWPALPQDVIEEAEDFIEWQAGQGRLYPISHRATVVCEVFKRLWRHAHPMTVRLWAELKDGFITATRHPSTTFRYRGLKFRRDGAWLRVQLPSGRALCYPHPEVDDSGQCSYMGVHQFTRKWTRIKTHGGKLAENAVQSLSRDVMFDRLQPIEAAGYPLIMRVHDEVITETPDEDTYNVDGLCQLLAIAPDWADGFPLAAAGFEGYRYRK